MTTPGPSRNRDERPLLVVVIGMVLGVTGLVGAASASAAAPGSGSAAQPAAAVSAAGEPAEAASADVDLSEFARPLAVLVREASVGHGTEGPAARETPAGHGASIAGSPGADEPAPEPATVLVPAIGVEAELVPLGLQPDGAMELPDFGTAGWYELGPMPGEDGPAVIAAHLDDQQGPDVFYELEQLVPGDEVTVTRADGSTVSFVVEDMEFTLKEALPVERIWGPTDGPTLRLITCGGTFDRRTGHYRSNLIVYATLAS
jgi:hypothetical protein